MKKTIVGLAILLMAATAVTAQQPDASVKQPHHKQFRQHGRGVMAKKLNFSDQQKEQFNSINSDYHKKMAELKKQDEITVKEMNTRMKTLQQEHKAALQALLTPAQKDQLVKMKDERSKMAKVNARARAERLKIKLNLTDAQSGQLTGMRTEMTAKIKAIHSDNSLSRQQKKEQVKTLVTAQKEQLKSILTPEQVQQLEQLKQQRHKRDFVK